MVGAAATERQIKIPPAQPLGETVWDLGYRQKMQMSQACRKLKISTIEAFQIIARQKLHLEARVKLRALKCGMGSDDAWQRIQALKDAPEPESDHDDDGETED